MFIYLPTVMRVNFSTTLTDERGEMLTNNGCNRLEDGCRAHAALLTIVSMVLLISVSIHVKYKGMLVMFQSLALSLPPLGMVIKSCVSKASCNGYPHIQIPMAFCAPVVVTVCIFFNNPLLNFVIK